MKIPYFTTIHPTSTEGYATKVTIGTLCWEEDNEKETNRPMFSIACEAMDIAPEIDPKSFSAPDVFKGRFPPPFSVQREYMGVDYYFIPTQAQG